MASWRVALGMVWIVGVAGCGGEGGASGSAPAGSGAPAAGVSGSPAAGVSGAPAKAAGGGKLVHHKQTKDECTFEFDAPEELKPTEKDGMSFTLASASYSFAGFAGASLYGLDQLAGLTTMGTKDTVLVKETANKLNLVVTRSEKPPSDPIKFIGGHGEEAEHEGRQLGCSYLCWGTKEREAETVAMCRSVKITYTEEKK